MGAVGCVGLCTLSPHTLAPLPLLLLITSHAQLATVLTRWQATTPASDPAPHRHHSPAASWSRRGA